MVLQGEYRMVCLLMPSLAIGLGPLSASSDLLGLSLRYGHTHLQTRQKKMGAQTEVLHCIDLERLVSRASTRRVHRQKQSLGFSPAVERLLAYV
jgi:hypothetical protein